MIFYAGIALGLWANYMVPDAFHEYIGHVTFTPSYTKYGGLVTSDEHTTTSKLLERFEAEHKLANFLTGLSGEQHHGSHEEHH